MLVAMPVIDTTSAVLFAAGSVVIALVLCTSLRRHKRDDPGIRWLAASNCAFLLAAGGVLLSVKLGFVTSVVLVIGGAYVGICGGWFAVLSAEGAPVPWRRVLAIGIAAVATQGWLAFEFENVVLLMLSSSIVNSALIGFILWRVWALIRPHSTRLASLMCMPFAVLLVGYAVRIPVVMIWPEGSMPILATMMIIVAMSWASVILELAMIALREAQVQAQLRVALAKAEAATQARTRFLLGISHDLRTPLNAILGLSELMRNEVLGCLPAGYSEQAKHIHKHGVELHELVSDLLLHASHEPETDNAVVSTIDDVAAAVEQKFSGNIEPEPVVEPRSAVGS